MQRLESSIDNREYLPTPLASPRMPLPLPLPLPLPSSPVVDESLIDILFSNSNADSTTKVNDAPSIEWIHRARYHPMEPKSQSILLRCMQHVKQLGNDTQTAALALLFLQDLVNASLEDPFHPWADVCIR